MVIYLHNVINFAIKMSKQKYIHIITIVGLISIFSLQSLWLCNTYLFIKEEIKKECTDLFDQALYKEANIISKSVPNGTVIGGGAPNDSISITTYIYDGIGKLGYKYSLSEIDSLTNLQLNKKNIKSEFIVCIVDSCRILQTSKRMTIPQLGSIKTEVIPTKLDKSIGLQLVLTNPYWNIFNKMWIILITTIIMTILTIVCTVYQIKFIFKLNKISQIREDFSYAMVHDMKTPLSTIMMVQDMLKSGRLEGKPEIKNKYMNIAESETEHLFALTNKILTISKLENHKLEMNKTEVELTPIIEKLTEKFKAKAQKPVNFIISLQAKTAYADNDYLGEVLSNLIDNAIKYSKESMEINITAEESERYTILKVRDNGLGISEADQRIIFQKYERAAAAKRSRRNGASGFGLGLNFVDQIIKAHDGRIFVNSTEGEFTEFTIYFPLENPNNIHNR